MSFHSIQSILDSRLNSLIPDLNLPVAWEGTNYEIVNGQAFLRPTNIRAISDQLSLANDIQSNTGIYQIDVFYPSIGTGTGPVLDIADRILSHFKSDLKLSLGSVDLHIRSVSFLPLGIEEDSWIISGVQVAYASYS